MGDLKSPDLTTSLLGQTPLKKGEKINIFHKCFFVQAMLACYYLQAGWEHPHDNKVNNSDLIIKSKDFPPLHQNWILYYLNYM